MSLTPAVPEEAEAGGTGVRGQPWQGYQEPNFFFFLFSLEPNF
jgi:hypothetical protein